MQANGNLFALKVVALNGQFAFGAAAKLVEETDTDHTATFTVAIPGHGQDGTAFDLPGDSTVDLDTDQLEVFGLTQLRGRIVVHRRHRLDNA